MILNHLSSKLLALYGVLETYDSYTVDSDSLEVNATVSIGYNLTDIQERIDDLNLQITELDNDEEMDEELKMCKLDDLQEVLEILTVIKDKIDG